MAETYKDMLKRATKKGDSQETTRPTSAVGAVAFPRGGGKDGFVDYVNSIYDASKRARTAQLEAAYNKAASDLAAARASANVSYGEAQRLTAGEAARQQAAFRETANANGLNTGASGQAALAMGNQMQNDMASLGRAKAQDMSELDRQRMLLAQNYEQQRQQMIAENDYNRNAALYNESVRRDDANRQQEQFDRQMNMQMLQMAMAERQRQIAAAQKAAKSSGGGGYEGKSPELSIGNYDDAINTLAMHGIEGHPLSKEQFIQQMKSGNRLPDNLNIYRAFGYDYESDPDDYYGRYLSDFVNAKLLPD